MLDNIIGVEEAARILELSPGTVKNKCAAGQLPAKKIGKTWIIDKTKLEELKMTKEIMLSVEPAREKEMKWAIENRAVYIYKGIKFIDLAFFHTFIADKVKADFIDFEKYLDELIENASEEHYELGSYETKSGNPADISFEYTYDFDEGEGITSNEVIEF